MTEKVTVMEKILLLVLAAMGAILLLLFIVACLRAFIIKKEYTTGKPFDMEKEMPDWRKHVTALSEIIKVPTVSIRGSDDKSKIYELHALFSRLYPNIKSSCEIKDIDGALLIRWQGKNPDKNPILLMSHQDVVEATGKWKHEAFAGDIADGKIWGRGTVDTKGALCAILESVEALISEGFVPYCDVYVASSNNEEITGDGAVKTVEYLFQRGIKFDLVMDEGGLVNAVENYSTKKITPHNAMIGVVEKGRANIKFIARSKGGHASVPFNDNPFARLSKLVYIIEHKNPFKKRITKAARLQYRAMAPYMQHYRHRLLYGNLWLFAPIAPYIMHRLGGPMGAVVKTTCIFTMAEGSKGANVIPEKATMTANCRFMTHEPLQPSYKKLQKISSKLGIQMEMITGFDVPPVADMKCYAYKFLSKQIKDTFGDIPQVPYIMLAGTDSRHYTKICDCVVRFVPLMMTSQQLNSAHAIDENLNVESLVRGVKFYHDFIMNYGKDLETK